VNPEFRKWDLTGFLPGVHVAVMVIQGEDDEYGTIAQVDAVCGGVAGPAEKVILPGCGHAPQRDKRAETLAAIVRFVRRS
jgi:pimeloyl-ACP methyl ester carboxylesterase